MIKRALHETVLFEKLEEVNKSSIMGVSTSELVRIKVLDWGTHRDGTPFPNLGEIAYIKSDSRGIDLGEGKWLINRGHVIGLE